MNKFIIAIAVLFCSVPLVAQDYFAVVKHNNNKIFRYPASVTMYLSGNAVERRKLEKDEAINITGNYTLEIEVPWRNDPEIIYSDGGTLKVFILPVEARKETKITKQKIVVASNIKPGKMINVKDSAHHTGLKPAAISKMVTKSRCIAGVYNLSIRFSNGLEFNYEDGRTNAWQNGRILEIKNHYLVQTPEGLLKLSFDPANGETWWVFELKQNFKR